MSSIITEVKRYYVTYSDDCSTSTFIALAADERDILAYVEDKGNRVVSITPEESAPSWMGEGKSYGTVTVPHVVAEVEREHVAVRALRSFAKWANHLRAEYSESGNEREAFALECALCYLSGYCEDTDLDIDFDV